jgi:hypothetical protein
MKNVILTENFGISKSRNRRNQRKPTEPAEPTETCEIYKIHAWKIILFFKVFCQLIRWPIVWNWLLYYKIKTNVNTQTNISPLIGYFEKFLAALERD